MKCCAQEPEPEPEEAAGPVATDEASLAAALMRGEPVTLARGTVIRLTRTLLIYKDFDLEAFFSKETYRGSGKYRKREDYHCECRRLRPSPRERVRGRRLRGGVRREG